MKTLFISLILFCCLGVNSAFGQEGTKLFAQGLFDIENRENMLNIQSTMSDNPAINIVRLDDNTQRFFLITEGIGELSIETLKSWFGEYAQTVHCIQIGIYGQDTIHSYPFTCED